MHGKKSFLLYADVKTVVDLLSAEKAGELFKTILDYVNDLDPTPNDPLVAVSFAPIKQQLKRDLNKWNGIKEKRSQAGKKSAEIRKQQKATKVTSVKFDEQTPTKLTVNDNVNVNVSVNDNVSVNVKKENNNIEVRKTSFGAALKPFLDQYGEPMLKEFFDYWTEHNEKGKKLRFEYAKNQPFNVSRRLGTWSKKETAGAFTKKGTKKHGDGIDADYLNELNQRINGEQ